MKITSLTCAAMAVVLLSGCQSTPLSPQASHILVTPKSPPKGCKYLGQVVGNQGDFFTGAWTSNRNLEEGALNDLRNKASQLGANYVHMITHRAGNTGGGDYYSGFSMSQTNVTNSGNAYRCPQSAF